jgi:hypothetical protein
MVVTCWFYNLLFLSALNLGSPEEAGASPQDLTKILMLLALVES